jgi:undecaprenyl-diphosphatase
VEDSRSSRAWWFAAATFVSLYAALALLIRVAPNNAIDRSVFDWVAGWNVPLIDTTMEWISRFTDLRPRLALGFVAIIAIALSRRYRLAALTLAVVTVAVVTVNGLDVAGGIIADRIRPNGAPLLAYPSGHTLGTVVQYGLAIFLALRLNMRRRFLVPVVALLALPIVPVGPARVLVGAHWTTDVLGSYLLGSYLLGSASVIVLVLLFEIGERWSAGRDLLNDAVRPSLARSTTAQD